MMETEQMSRRVRILSAAITVMLNITGAVVLAQSTGAVAQPPAEGRRAESAAATQPGAAAQRDALNPKALDILRKMGAALQRENVMQFETSAMFDVIRDDDTRVQLSRAAEVTMRRPAGLRVRAGGDDGERDYWYDGRTVSIHDRKHNVYSQVSAPATLDEMFDFMADRYDMSVPISDLLFADPYAALTDGIIIAEYVGEHRAGGRKCHHLLFESETVAWQIWIDSDGPPLPRKLVVAALEQPGTPQYIVFFDAWKFEKSLERESFEFRPPSDAERVELLPVGADPTEAVPPPARGATTKPAAGAAATQPAKP